MVCIIIIILIFFLSFMAKKMSRMFFRFQESMQEKEIKQEQYLKELLDSSRRIEESINPSESKPDYLQSLLDANREIQEKNKLSRAIEEELGIQMTD